MNAEKPEETNNNNQLIPVEVATAIVPVKPDKTELLLENVKKRLESELTPNQTKPVLSEGTVPIDFNDETSNKIQVQTSTSNSNLGSERTNTTDKSEIKLDEDLSDGDDNDEDLHGVDIDGLSDITEEDEEQEFQKQDEQSTTKPEGAINEFKMKHPKLAPSVSNEKIKIPPLQIPKQVVIPYKYNTNDGDDESETSSLTHSIEDVNIDEILAEASNDDLSDDEEFIKNLKQQKEKLKAQKQTPATKKIDTTGNTHSSNTVDAVALENNETGRKVSSSVFKPDTNTTHPSLADVTATPASRNNETKSDDFLAAHEGFNEDDVVDEDLVNLDKIVTNTELKPDKNSKAILQKQLQTDKKKIDKKK